jgi:serine/threonine-protein kinase
MDGVGIQQIGRYRVINVIGEGGMGVVYLAVDEAISRQVAIKMLRAPAGDTDVLARFNREVRSTANLQHKNIVTVYALDDFQGFPYMVMEYLEGQSIAHLISSRRPMHIVEKLNIVSQICEGLQYAHEQSVIHRDIKPANILVLKNGTAKIVDFGIARVGRGETITRTGQIVGSIYWMSPEQISGIPVDCRTDVYSTGVLLFQFLTGELPFQGADSDPNATFIKILNDPVPALNKYLSSYPCELDDILRKAMAKKLEERFQTAEEFGDELTRLCESLRIEMSKEFLEQARVAVEQQDYEIARYKLQEVLKVDRRNIKANELFQRVRELMQRQHRLAQIDQLRSQAQMAFAAHQYEEALECAEQACRLEPENQELSAFAASVKEEVERVRAIAEALRRGQAAFYAGDLQEASSAVQQALALDHNHNEARTLDDLIRKELEERDRRSQLHSYVEQARRDISNRDFFSALRSLQQAKSIDPSDSNIQELLNWAVRGHEQEKQRQALQKATDQIGKLIGESKFADALAVGRDAQTRHPEDQSLAKLCQLAERQLEQQQRKKAVEGVGANVRRLIDENQSDKAIESLQNALKEFPGEPTLETLLAIARSEFERKEAEREEGERRLKALSVDTNLTDSRIRERQDILGLVSSLRSGLARKRPMHQLIEIAARLEQVPTIAEMGAEVTTDLSRALSEFQSRHAKWTKDCEEIRQIRDSLPGSKNIETIEAFVDRARLLASQYEKDERISADWSRITVTTERLKAERDAVASEATALLHAMQAETQLEKITAIGKQLDELCASWRGDPLIANLVSQGETQASDLRERKEQLSRDLTELGSSIKNARSAGQVALIQEHAKMLAAEIQDPETLRALQTIEKCGKQRLEELNSILTRLREISANIQIARSLSQIEQYEAAANEYQAKSDASLEISETLAAIGRITAVRRREHARTENNLNQLVASAGKASDQAALDLILARARDLIKRYSEDQQIGSLGVQLEAAVNERRVHLASEAASRSQTFDDLDEPLDLESGLASVVGEAPPATGVEKVGEAAKRPSTANRISLAAVTVCVVIIVALGAYLIAPRTIVIATNPAGAAVTVDDLSCNSPCTLRLRAGQHHLEAATAGFAPFQEDLEVPLFGASQPVLTLSQLPSAPTTAQTASSIATMPPAGGNSRLLIQTSLPGVSVFLDDSPSAAGKTDLSGELRLPTTAGPHQVRVQKDGLDNSAVRTVVAKPDRVTVARFELKQTTAGSLQTAQTAPGQAAPNSNPTASPAKSAAANPPVLETFLIVHAPAGAEIHINQQLAGHSTGSPFKVKVEPGQNSVEIFLSGYQPYSQNVNVAPGDQANLPVKLTPVPPPVIAGTPAVASTSAGVSDKDRTEIQALLDHYAEGYSQKNIKAIQTLWPSIPTDTVKTVKDFFKMSKSVQMQILVGSAVPAGKRVVVTCTQTLRFSIDGKDMVHTESKTLYVVKANDSWLIDFIPNS